MRYRLPVLCAALLALPMAAVSQAPSPQPPNQQPASASASATALSASPMALQRCDRAIGEAETMAQRITECASGLSSELAAMTAEATTKPSTVARGLPDLRIREIPEDVSTPAAKQLLSDATPVMMRTQLVDYFAYLGYAASDPAACKRLAVIGLETNCRENYVLLAEMRALLGEPWERIKACRAPENKTPAKCCTLIAQYRGEADFCRQMVPGCAPDMGSCQVFLGRTNGDKKVCDLVPHTVQEYCKADNCRQDRLERVARCVEETTFARAFKAKDASQCGTSLRCRTLMGAGKEAAAEMSAKYFQNPAGAWFTRNGWKAPPVEAAAATPVAPTTPRKSNLDYKGFVCALPLQSADNRKVATNIVVVAQTCLTDIEAALQTPSRALSEGIEQREEKLARLSVRMDMALGGAAKPAASPANRPAKTRSSR